MKFQNINAWDFLNFLVISFVLHICQFASSTELLRPRGVAQTKTSFYQADRSFTCFDGSNTIPFQMVNDDYCDCSDGTDEPGTSACPNGLFHCENKAHFAKDISSAFVNDGICDCCDGSDEYTSRNKCENTCLELGRKVRDAAERLAAEMNEGYKVRERMVEESKQIRENKQIELSNLQKEKDELEKQKQDLEDAKNAAEEPEKAAKESHKKKWEDEREQKESEKQLMRIRTAFDDLDINSDGIVNEEELVMRAEFDIDSDGVITREELQNLLGDESLHYDYDTFHERIWDEVKDVYIAPVTPVETPPTPTDTPDPPISDEGDGVDDDVYEDDSESYNDDDDDEDYDDGVNDDVDPDLNIDGARRLELPDGVAPGEVMPEYDDETKKLIQVADDARKVFEESNSRLSQVTSQIGDIERSLSGDMGPLDEFLGMEKQCYELNDSKEYIYRVCVFDRVSQKPRQGGHPDNSLGVWEGWSGPENNKYSEMKYSNGAQCWNGPARSTLVKLVCGKENEVLSASEPNRCEYAVEFATPAACHRMVSADDIVRHQHHQPHALHDEL